MDLRVILNPSPQSQCSVESGEMTWSSRLHSPYSEAIRATRRGPSADIHREQHRGVNGSLTQSLSSHKVSDNRSSFSSFSSSNTSLDLDRDEYCDQIEVQSSFAKTTPQSFITKSHPSLRPFKNSNHHLYNPCSSPSLCYIRPHSTTMVLPHCSSLETLASVATANASARKPPHTHARISTITDISLEGIRLHSQDSDCSSHDSNSRPRSNPLPENHHQREAPDDSENNPDVISRGSSHASGTVILDDFTAHPSNTTDGGPSCSYTAGCSTGSPLRKVVSHIFGRNKLCTRQIPKGVWVHYCRKHYQRSRYRNPSGFALLQCDLVRKQIDRLDIWGGVSDWIIKVRKREELRLNKENAELAAGRIAEDADSDQDGNTAGARSARESTPSGKEGSLCGSVDSHLQTTRQSTAAPTSSSSSRWLIKFTGNGKTTAEALEVLDIIESEIRDTKSNFPDIEILPNVSPPGTGSDHQRSLSSLSSSSSSSSSSLAHANDAVDHQQRQESKRKASINSKGSSSESPIKRRTLKRGLRPSSSDNDDDE